MLSGSIVLGVDGGGTATRAVLLDSEGQILSYGMAGPGNPKAVGLRVAKKSAAEAVERAWAALSSTPRPAAAAFLGVAGLGREEDRLEYARAIRSLNLAPKNRLGCGHDLEIALEGGLAGRDGIVVVCGTGSSCYGRNSAGQTARSGGWGWLVDDAGSGYWLGIQAMRAAVRAADGRDPMSCLVEEVRSFFGLTDIFHLPMVLYYPQVSRDKVAALAPLVFKAAAEGDRLSESLLRQTADELSQAVWAVSVKLGYDRKECTVVLTGGIASAQPALFHLLRAALATRLPDAKLVSPLLPPVLGAAIKALRLAGVEVVNTLRLTIQESLAQREEALWRGDGDGH